MSVAKVAIGHWHFHVGGITMVAALASFLGPSLARLVGKSGLWAMLVVASVVAVGVIATFTTSTVFKAVYPFTWWVEQDSKTLEGHAPIRLPLLPELAYAFVVFIVGLSVGVCSAVVWGLSLMTARSRHARAAQFLFEPDRRM